MRSLKGYVSALGFGVELLLELNKALLGTL